MNLLKPEELPENIVKENEDTAKPSTEKSSESSHSDKEDPDSDDMEEFTDENGMRVRRVVTKTVTTTSTKTSSDNGEPKHLTRETLQMESGQGGGDTDENTEVIEYVDENGRRVRRIVKKRITTTTRITSKNDGPSSVTTETKEISSGGHDPEGVLINFGGGMPRPSEEHSKLQPDIKPLAVQEKEVFLQFGSQPSAKQESHVKVDIKGQPFQIRNVNMFGSKARTTITNESPAGNKTVYQRTVVTKTIGGDDGGTKVVEHSTTTSSHGDHPIMAVTKEKQINMPDWMDERSSPETKRKNPGMSDISLHLKYPSDYAPKNKDLESSANESRIHPQDAKRDKPVITMLSLDDVVKEKEKGEVTKPEKTEEKPAPPQASEEDEEEEEEEDDEEVDEFEEEIVVLEVRRKPRFHKALERPTPEPEKTGIPIEDLLEIPTLEVGQESAPDDNLIDEQVEYEERPQTVYEAPDLSELLKEW